MRYERKIGKIPEESGTFHSKELLGKIQATDYPARVDQVCTTQPPPPPQKRFNPKTNKTEQFKPDGTFYAPNEPREKMKKCTEWTEEQDPSIIRLWRPVTERVRPEGLGVISARESHQGCEIAGKS
jgi:hypothetical protein